MASALNFSRLETSGSPRHLFDGEIKNFELRVLRAHNSRNFQWGEGGKEFSGCESLLFFKRGKLIKKSSK